MGMLPVNVCSDKCVILVITALIQFPFPPATAAALLWPPT